ncbi:MAG: hemerythrin family protein [Eubacterium sp.]|nr:hemerythrin family protein [Eubacterium sp.]
MFIEFDDTLITGNDTIDNQHKELIDRISKFVHSCEDGADIATSLEMLDYLKEYTSFHFSAEEKLQEDVSYPGLAEHRKKHEEYKATLEALSSSLKEKGADANTSEEIKESVVDWLFNHIKVFDRSVAEFIHLYENPELL